VTTVRKYKVDDKNTMTKENTCTSRSLVTVATFDRRIAALLTVPTVIAALEQTSFWLASNAAILAVLSRAFVATSGRGVLLINTTVICRPSVVVVRIKAELGLNG